MPGKRSWRDELRNALYQGLTGESEADVTGQRGGGLRGQLLAIGGHSTRTRSGIDLSAAAEKLGVGRGTVGRWVRAEETGTGQRPSAANQKALAKTARQAASTKAGRRAARARSAVAARAAQRGARLAIEGNQGPLAAGVTYLRPRTTVHDLDPEDVQAMLDAWENGGEKGFMDWATDYAGENYLDDWRFGERTDEGIYDEVVTIEVDPL